MWGASSRELEGVLRAAFLRHAFEGSEEVDYGGYEAFLASLRRSVDLQRCLRSVGGPAAVLLGALLVSGGRADDWWRELCLGSHTTGTVPWWRLWQHLCESAPCDGPARYAHIDRYDGAAACYGSEASTSAGPSRSRSSTNGHDFGAPAVPRRSASAAAGGRGCRVVLDEYDGGDAPVMVPRPSVHADRPSSVRGPAPTARYSDRYVRCLDGSPAPMPHTLCFGEPEAAHRILGCGLATGRDRSRSSRAGSVVINLDRDDGDSPPAEAAGSVPFFASPEPLARTARGLAFDEGAAIVMSPCGPAGDGAPPQLPLQQQQHFTAVPAPSAGARAWAPHAMDPPSPVGHGDGAHTFAHRMALNATAATQAPLRPKPHADATRADAVRVLVVEECDGRVDGCSAAPRGVHGQQPLRPQLAGPRMAPLPLPAPAATGVPRQRVCKGEDGHLRYKGSALHLDAETDAEVTPLSAPPPLQRSPAVSGPRESSTERWRRVRAADAQQAGLVEGYGRVDGTTGGLLPARPTTTGVRQTAGPSHPPTPPAADLRERDLEGGSAAHIRDVDIVSEGHRRASSSPPARDSPAVASGLSSAVAPRAAWSPRTSSPSHPQPAMRRDPPPRDYSKARPSSLSSEPETFVVAFPTRPAPTAPNAEAAEDPLRFLHLSQGQVEQVLRLASSRCPSGASSRSTSPGLRWPSKSASRPSSSGVAAQAFPQRALSAIGGRSASPQPVPCAPQRVVDYQRGSRHPSPSPALHLAATAAPGHSQGTCVHTADTASSTNTACLVDCGTSASPPSAIKATAPRRLPQRQPLRQHAASQTAASPMPPVMAGTPKSGPQEGVAAASPLRCSPLQQSSPAVVVASPSPPRLQLGLGRPGGRRPPPPLPLLGPLVVRGGVGSARRVVAPPVSRVIFRSTESFANERHH